MDDIDLNKSGVHWCQDRWGMRIREPSLVGKRKRLRAYIDVLWCDESGQPVVKHTAETWPLDASEAAAFLATVDPKGVLYPDLLRIASETRQRLIAGPASQPVAGSGRKPNLIRMSEVEPEKVPWLWYPYIPLRKLTLVEGDPARGKSYLVLAIASIVSTGGCFLDDDGRPTLSCEPGVVVYMTAEDGLSDTVRPRLDSVGANVANVHALDGWKSDDGTSGAVTLKDLDVLRSVMEEVHPRLVIVDPVQAYLGSGVDMHRANEVRPILAGLADLAAEHNAGILIIRHLSKSLQAQDLCRGMGSIDFTAAARSVIAVGADPDDEHTRVMAHLKSSLAPIGASLAFAVTQGQFTWLGKTDLTVGDLLGPQRGHDSKAKFEQAKAFLLDALKDGPVPSDAVNKKAAAQGVATKTLQRARSSLKKTHSLKTERTNGIWMMSIPISVPDGQDGQDDQDSSREDDGYLGHLTEDIENKEISLDGQDGHMAILQTGSNYYTNQQVMQDSQDGHLFSLKGFHPQMNDNHLNFQGPAEGAAVPTLSQSDSQLTLFDAGVYCPQCGSPALAQKHCWECPRCGYDWGWAE